MSAPGYEMGARAVLKELLTYKSGALGLGIVMFLLALSFYTVITIPYGRAIALWRGEGGIWLDKPRNAMPIWAKYILGRNLPENIVMDTREKGVGIVKAITPIPGTNFKKLHVEFTFRYPYDGFPSELNLFFNAKYEEAAPLLYIYWVKPEGEEIKLLDYVLRAPDDTLYLSINPEAYKNALKHVVASVGEPETEIPIEVCLFGVEDESILSTETAKPLKGVYKLVIRGTLFGEASDIDVKMVIYGRVWGLAGTDHLRRDLLIALLWGTPVAIAFGLSASLTISAIQLIIATISGYYGGKVDALVQRLTEIYMIIPFLPFLILLATFYKLTIWIILAVVIILSIFGGGIKSTRALVMQIKEYPYIEAAKAYGASDKRIIFLYIIPKILPPRVPGLIGAIPGYVFLEAGLSFLGLGDPYLPTWGKVINDAYSNGALYKGYYYWVLEPSFMLILTALAFAFLGFALDKIVNPRLREM